MIQWYMHAEWDLEYLLRMLGDDKAYNRSTIQPTGFSNNFKAKQGLFYYTAGLQWDKGIHGPLYTMYKGPWGILVAIMAAG